MDLDRFFAPLAAPMLLVLFLSAGGESAYERGLKAFQKHDWENAERALRQATIEQPRSARAWKFLGMVFVIQERFSDAIEPLTQACALDRSEENACYYLGRAYTGMARFDSAQAAFERARAGGATAERLALGEALLYEGRGEDSQAELYFRRAIRGGDAEMLHAYGLFLLRAGRGAEALTALERAGDQAEVERVRRVLAGAGGVGEGFAPQPVKFEVSELPMTVRNGAYGKKHQVETMLAGVAAFDYDNDGWPDIFVCNGAELPGLDKRDASYSNRLFHNNRDGTFTDVTARSGLAGSGYSMGVAAGDFDNDGWVDLFVTGVHGNSLYRNKGDGTFEDVTERAGLRGDGSWSVAAGWFDYDNDGLLDLFVVRYVAWDPATEPFCGDPRPGGRAYCHPRMYKALANALYHNEGGGRFRDVSRESGIAAHAGKGMGVAFGDYDGDGRLDVFVANDTVPNFLFRNEGGGRFRECALDAGVAMTGDGVATSSMGVEFRDYDNDGREDLFFTTLTNERFMLFRNLGNGLFVDVSGPSRVAGPSLPYSGWSLGLVDLNNDGFRDALTANGNVVDNAERISDRKSRQPMTAFLNRGNGKFALQELPGAAFHRGAAFADFDRDGRMDAVVTRLNQAPIVLHNVTPQTGHWLELRLEGRRSNRDAIGARVRVLTPGLRQWGRVTTSSGYAASSDRVLHFGLGTATRVLRIDVEWPSGARQTITDAAADRLMLVEEPENK